MGSRIEVRTDILLGKPVIAGTRIPVYLILNLLASGHRPTTSRKLSKPIQTSRRMMLDRRPWATPHDGCTTMTRTCVRVPRPRHDRLLGGRERLSRDRRSS